MTNREVEKELNQIYKKMDAWPTTNKKANYKIPQKEVERREVLKNKILGFAKKVELEFINTRILTFLQNITRR
ncbi:MAG: hypothetical protein A3G39_11185 [Deltaproteobacteria bacterium RIFCSPLOWO2_12_FULL_43_16]|nr:MAG: hypothetical protein A2Z89_04920 [Deltaproteobacteria bacterium GWA2_43_19]OGQ11298.1 MAG: hypothetical protein A3D30_06300 [Deltaproteobacteria bacterium RIFCSPHIGHO2_02_FULL_43_33]OGQ60597.1 MAG: hypothetical protein A3G39_11185 [Deltaproteobacteria bacterium RIFCSPLOWO2_12_FULL_43_16]HBR16076.1 hypothetical protein [Deltaproteobacteria bacterium]